MAQPESTCWTVIRGAADGSSQDREQFAQRYLPVVRAYLAARWRTSPLLADLDDAVQEVFVECFKPQGLLQQADPQQAGGFRAFLYSAVRHVALRHETRRARRREHQADKSAVLEQAAADEDSLSAVFDRAWAKALLREAAQRQEVQAGAAGPAAQRRVELLRLRFHEGLPIRDIARRWDMDAAVLHHEYARARHEFKAALLEVVGFHHPGSPEEIAQECANLMALLG